MMMLYKYHNGKPEPQLLVSENFNEFDIAKFRVINGYWDGRYVSGAVFVEHPFYGSNCLGSYEIYKFKETPQKDYFDDCDKMNGYSYRDKMNGYSYRDKSYDSWFWLFRDLVEKGEIV